MTDELTVGEAVVVLTELADADYPVLYPADARAIRVVLDALAASGKDTEKVTRVEVIYHRTRAPDPRRVFVALGCAPELSYQDDGRTLKVFVNDAAALARTQGEG